MSFKESNWHFSYRKQMFQSTLFPQGLAFDSKINDYRTPVVNLVIARNAELSRSFAQNEKRTALQFAEQSDLVQWYGRVSNKLADSLMKFEH